MAPGTPGGAWMRRYWVAACLSSELPEQDGAPLRLRLLGEDLIAFRDTNGEVGIVDAYCPHRRAPLFFGRNEECGLRCVYHGWKFDRHGTCVDMPSEPAGTTLQAKVKILSYPTYEKAGIVWTYMGPKDKQPPVPDYEWMRVPNTHLFISKTFQNCNWLQGLEGALDTAHSSFLHNNHLKNSHKMLRQRDTSPRIDVERTDYGYSYTSHRNLGDDGFYVRLHLFIMPHQQQRAQVLSWDGAPYPVPRNFVHLWVPIDDEKTYVYNIHHSADPEKPLTPELVHHHEKEFGRAPDDIIPGTFRLKRNQSNDYGIDRAMQKTQNFTGIVGVNTQDLALQEGMGAICDRSKEFLGTSDKAVIAMRRLVLEGIDSVAAGETPRGLDPASYRALAAWDSMVPKGADWREVLAPKLVARW